MLIGNSNNMDYQSKYKYDSAGRVTANIRSISGFVRNTGFAYNKFGQASNVKITGSLYDINGTNTYDSLGRLTKKQWTTGASQNYTSAR